MLIGILLTSLLIAFTGCSGSINVDNEKLKMCEGKTEQTLNSCLDSLVVSEKNLAYCDKIQTDGTSQYLRDGGGRQDKYECYWHGIYAIGDKSACENLGKGSIDKPGKDDCISRLYQFNFRNQMIAIK